MTKDRSDILQPTTFIIVAFKVGEENSVLYVKLKTPSDSELGKQLNKACHDKGADFVSVRFVRS